MKKPLHILVPTDLSLFSMEAFLFGQEIAEMFDSKVTVVYVDDVGHGIDPMTATIDADSRVTSTRKKAIMGRVQHMLVDNNLAHRDIRIDVRFGDPAQEIVQESSEIQADLIVMSTHGRTGLRHVLLGSVAEKVVRYSKCPVLTMKPEEVREFISLTEGDISDTLHLRRGLPEMHH